jgi:hypothetical protein
MTYLLPKTTEVFQGPTVDFTTTGAYTIFQPLSTFIITGITFVAVDVSGGVMGFAANLGTNPPDFDNYVAGIGSSITVNGKYQFFSLGGTVNNIIQGGSDLKINVSMPDLGATTNKQRVDILGYYL